MEFEVHIKSTDLEAIEFSRIYVYFAYGWIIDLIKFWIKI
jgi:hypothetical protein